MTMLLDEALRLARARDRRDELEQQARAAEAQEDAMGTRPKQHAIDVGGALGLSGDPSAPAAEVCPVESDYYGACVLVAGHDGSHRTAVGTLFLFSPPIVFFPVVPEGAVSEEGAGPEDGDPGSDVPTVIARRRPRQLLLPHVRCDAFTTRGTRCQRRWVERGAGASHYCAMHMEIMVGRMTTVERVRYAMRKVAASWRRSRG